MLAIPTSEIAEVCRRWRIEELALFGSALRDDFHAGSDVDLLVTFAPDAAWSTLDLVDVQSDFAGLFGRRVDLVEKSTLRNPFRRRAILSNHKVLYAA